MPSAKRKCLMEIFSRLIPVKEIPAEPPAHAVFGGMSRTEIRNAMFAHAYGTGSSILGNSTIQTISDEISNYARMDVEITGRMQDMVSDYTRLMGHQRATLVGLDQERLTTHMAYVSAAMASTPARFPPAFSLEMPINLEMSDAEIRSRVTTNSVVQSRTAEDALFDFWDAQGAGARA